MSGQPVGPAGPAPQTGAFEVGSALPPGAEAPPAQPMSGPLQQSAMPMPPGALEQPTAAPGAPEAPKSRSVHEIVAQMTPKERNMMARGIKKKTGKSVDDLYADMVRSGDIAPPIDRKPNRKEKLPQLAEALLRFAQNMGSRGMTPSAAAATATLDTQGRRQALEQAQIEQDNALAEGRRSEVQGVLSARNARGVQLADKATERVDKAEEARVKAVDATALQKQQDDAAMARTKVQEGGANARAKQTNGKTFTDKDGKVFVIDGQTASPLLYDDVEAVPVGQGAFKEPKAGGSRKVKRQVQGLAGGAIGSAGLDQDTVLNRTVDMAKIIAEDRKQMRVIAEEAARTGRDQNAILMEKAAEALAARGPGGGAGGNAEYDYVPGRGLVKRSP